MYSSVALLQASLFHYCSWVGWASANLRCSTVLCLLLGGARCVYWVCTPVCSGASFLVPVQALAGFSFLFSSCHLHLHYLGFVVAYISTLCRGYACVLQFL